MIPRELDGAEVYVFHLTKEELWEHKQPAYDGEAKLTEIEKRTIRMSSSKGDIIVPSFGFDSDGKILSLKEENRTLLVPPKDEWIIPQLRDAIAATKEWEKEWEKTNLPIVHLIYRYDDPYRIAIMGNNEICTPNPNPNP